MLDGLRTNEVAHEGNKHELGLRGPEKGHYPNVVYEQPIYKKMNVTGDCVVLLRGVAINLLGRAPIDNYKVGIVGCGKIFNRHHEAIEFNENYELVAICDIDVSKKDQYSNLSVPFMKTITT